MLKRIAIETTSDAPIVAAVADATLPTGFYRDLYNLLNNGLREPNPKELAAKVSDRFELDYEPPHTVGGVLSNTYQAYPRFDYIEGKPGFYFALVLQAARIPPPGKTSIRFIDNPLADPQVRNNLTWLRSWVDKTHTYNLQMPKYIDTFQLGELATGTPIAKALVKAVGTGRQTMTLTLYWPVKLAYNSDKHGVIDLSTF